jgi:hypothetical protein
MSESEQGIKGLALKGRVAQILNERELVINIGAEQGVKAGMKFAVLAESPLDIKDPESGETLGVIDREKVRVKVSEVRPRLAICCTYRVIRTGSPSVADIFGSYRNSTIFGRGIEEKAETLRASDASLPPPLSPEESFVKVNDRVLQISENG